MGLTEDPGSEHQQPLNKSTHTFGLYKLWSLKGHYVVLEEKLQNQNFNIHSITEVTIQTQTYWIFNNWINNLFSEENKAPEHCLRLERWQGPPHISNVKQYAIVSSFKVTLFIQFSVCRYKNLGNGDLFLLLKNDFTLINVIIQLQNW